MKESSTSLVLSQIWIYPVKSLGGISLKSSNVLEKGLEFDRRYMLVTENNVFMTQRTFPQMAFFLPEIIGDNLIIHWKSDVLTIPLVPEQKGNLLSADVWNDSIQVAEMDQAYNQWFSERVGIKCKMVFFPEGNARPVNPNYQVKDEQVSLADGYPFLIIGEEAHAHLNLKLSAPVPMNRFRPNLIFAGGQPNEEDRWRNFRIGENRFIGVKPCERCVVTTVNHITGEMGKEPLATLSTYRRGENGKVYFGQNVIAEDFKKIEVGQKITVESYSS